MYSAKAAILSVELKTVNSLGLGECRHALQRMGEETLGLNDLEQLRSLLAARKLAAQAKVLRFPLRRSSKHPKATKSYLVIPVDVDDVGFMDFLLDTGSSGVLISAALRDALGVSPAAGAAVRGLDSAGLTVRQRVPLPKLRLGPQELDIREGYVAPLKDLREADVGGVLGLRFLSSFEIEIDPVAGSIAFHPRGHVDSGILDTSGMLALSLKPLKGGLLALTATLNQSAELPAILDLSACYTTINWAAARVAFRGLDASLFTTQVTSSDGALNTVVRKGGIDVVLGNLGHDPELYTPREYSTMLLRDMPSLAALGYNASPAMVVGRDLIGARRTVLCLADGKLYVQP